MSLQYSKSESTLEDALEVLLENDVIAYVSQIYDLLKSVRALITAM